MHVSCFFCARGHMSNAPINQLPASGNTQHACLADLPCSPYCVDRPLWLPSRVLAQFDFHYFLFSWDVSSHPICEQRLENNQRPGARTCSICGNPCLFSLRCFFGSLTIRFRLGREFNWMGKCILMCIRETIGYMLNNVFEDPPKTRCSQHLLPFDESSQATWTTHALAWRVRRHVCWWAKAVRISREWMGTGLIMLAATLYCFARMDAILLGLFAM